MDGNVVRMVKETKITLSLTDFYGALIFMDKGEIDISTVDTKKALTYIGCKKNEQLKGMKKKKFPYSFEILADIIGKFITCKYSEFDSVNELQSQVMSTITVGKKMNFGAIIFSWILKWFEDAEKRKKKGKPLPKMFFARILSIVIKVKIGEQIGLKEGEVLNVNKKMTNRLFDN